MEARAPAKMGDSKRFRLKWRPWQEIDPKVSSFRGPKDPAPLAPRNAVAQALIIRDEHARQSRVPRLSLSLREQGAGSGEGHGPTPGAEEAAMEFEEEL
eukprot:3548619-Alexandrium_andersonii.AAC.1